MANKRINELALRTPQTTDLMLIGDPTTGYSYKTTLLSALNLGVPTTRTITINGTTFDLSANRTWSVGTVTSVGLTMPAAFNVASSPVTGSGTIAVTAAGLATQYIRGDGTLADFPGGGGGGGASVSYYLNGSVNQGTIGGVTYYEMNKTPILGAGTNFTTSSNGYIASFLTDAGDPALLKIPGGNWNTEFYFAASSGGGTPTYYLELYKYDGTTFTLIASNSSNPDAITGGTSVEQYFTTLAVPETVLTATDRLAIRIYVTTAGRTITLHTENSNLCQIITTFTTGLTALNGLTAQVQYFATGSAGTDFNISSSTATHTFNIPTASATNRGLLSTADWTTFNNKVPYTGATANVDLGIYNLSAKSVFIEGTASYQSGLAMKQLNSFDFVSGEYTQIAPSSTTELNLVYNQSGGARRRAALSAASLQNGDSFQYLFPRQNGTFAMLTDISTAINGTTNWIPRFTSANTIGLSNLYDGSSFIGVFTATDNLSGAKLQVNGAATFSSSVTANSAILNSSGEDGSLGAVLRVSSTSTNTNARNWAIVNTWDNFGDLTFRVSTAQGGNALSAGSNVLTLLRTGAATFSSSVTAGIGTFASSSYINGVFQRTTGNGSLIQFKNFSSTAQYNWFIGASYNGSNVFEIIPSTVVAGNDPSTSVFTINNTGAATFSSTITSGAISATGVSTFNRGTLQMTLNPSYAGGNVYSQIQSTGDLAFATGGDSNKVYISSGASWGVGIGTANPGEKLTINGGLGFQYSGTQNWHIATNSSNNITFTRSGIADRMTITSDGNLGLGVTPSAWLSTLNALQIGAAHFFGQTTGNGTVSLGNNAYLNSTPAYIYQYNGKATRYSQYDGGHEWYTAPSGTAGNAISFTQAMTLNASGNLGIGVTSPTRALEVYSSNTSQTAQLIVSSGTNTKAYLGTFSNNLYLTSGGTFNGAWSTDGSNAIGAIVISSINNDSSIVFQTNNTNAAPQNRMLVNAAGRVLIGTTTDNTIDLLQVAGSGVFNSSTANSLSITTTNATTLFTTYRVNTSTIVGYIGNGTGIVSGGGNNNFGIRSESDLLFAAGGNAERMRITSGGDLLFNKTTLSGNSVGVEFERNSTNRFTADGTSVIYMNRLTSDGTILDIRRSGTQVGSISVTTTSTAYNTSSDYRLKTDLKDFAGVDIVRLIKVYDYEWLSDKSRSYGVLAHELQSVIPYAVTGVKDGDQMQGVDYSKIVPVLVKAIQEQQIQIEDLKSKLN